MTSPQHDSPAAAFTAGHDTHEAPAPAGRALEIQEPERAPEPEHNASPLGDLGRLRSEMAKRNYIDIRVPGWGEDPDLVPRVHVYVRCRPIKPSELQTIRDNRVPKGDGGSKKKGRSNDYVDMINADALVKTCLEVWAHVGQPADPDELEEHERFSLASGDSDGAKTKFDRKLALALAMFDPDKGEEAPHAPQIVMALFLHEGNVARAGQKLVEHSNLGAEREAADFMPS